MCGTCSIGCLQSGQASLHLAPLFPHQYIHFIMLSLLSNMWIHSGYVWSLFCPSCAWKYFPALLVWFRDQEGADHPVSTLVSSSFFFMEIGVTFTFPQSADTFLDSCDYLKCWQWPHTDISHLFHSQWTYMCAVCSSIFFYHWWKPFHHSTIPTFLCPAFSPLSGLGFFKAKVVQKDWGKNK